MKKKIQNTEKKKLQSFIVYLSVIHPPSSPSQDPTFFLFFFALSNMKKNSDQT